MIRLALVRVGGRITEEIGRLKRACVASYQMASKQARTYWPSGALFSQGTLLAGKKEGLWEEWRKDGRLAESGTYKGGELHGLFEHYWPSGKLAIRTYYKEGTQYGSYEFYHSNGQLAFRSQDGQTVRYTEAGSLFYQSTSS